VDVSWSHGIEFATVRTGNNLPFQGGDPFFPAVGRGTVAGDFRISRTEITTGQWLQFVNTFSTTRNDLSYFAEPVRWSARIDPTYSGPGARWVPDPAITAAADRPVAGISWRDAAMYCNWLHGGGTSNPQSLLAGAYDLSMFGPGGPGWSDGFTDQLVHSPGARYWIPNMDEWMRAAFAEPGSDRWWLSHYGSDDEPISGMPGTPGAQTDAGEFSADFNPVNSYTAQSPWGLLGTSGIVDEWLEDAAGTSPTTGLPVYRLIYSGVHGGDPPEGIFHVGLSGVRPDEAYYHGLRIAAAVPAPTAVCLFVPFSFVLCRRRR